MAPPVDSGDLIAEALQRLTRDDSGRVLALLARRFNDLDIADESVQEGLIEAALRWPETGVPDNPGGWLYRVAQRKAIDRIRRAGAEQRRVDGAAHELVANASNSDQPASGNDDMLLNDQGFELDDERLRLMLLCCHPALASDAQVALTLRLVAGLSTEEIAAAFLLPVPTMAARVTRAKKKIRAAKIPLSVPDELNERIDAILMVLYLVFNEGYLSRSASNDGMRVDLCDEAIQLVAVVAALAPDHAEARGLLALLRLTHARRDARFASNELVVLDEQDRAVWRLDEIQTGNTDLGIAMSKMRPGVFQLQAVIASHHSNARTAADTDWPKIVALYDQLLAMRPTPVVALNRAVSIAMADGPLAGLRALQEISGLDDYHLFHAARGELLAQADQDEEALAALRRAVELAANPRERDHLNTRIARLSNP